MEKMETVVVGGGQGGLSLSFFLRQAGREHIVMEKAARAGEAWRNQRWDSFTLVTPNWTFKLPGGEYQGDAPAGFMPRSEIVQRFEQYVEHYDLPVAFNATVESVAPLNGRGYRIQAGERQFQARNVVIATGAFQRGKALPFYSQIPPDVIQFTAEEYRNPDQLPPGAVLIVGSGQSGGQIAEELVENGRSVYLSTGTAGWVPRRYRGRDIVEWIDVIRFFDRPVDSLPDPRDRFIPNPMATGKNGGHDLNLHTLHCRGVKLLGRLRGVDDLKFFFSDNLGANIAKSDERAKQLMQRIDQAIQTQGIATPDDPYDFPEDAWQAQVQTVLDIKAEKIAAVVWACGFQFDYSLVKLPVVDEFGFPLTHRGVTRFPGLYFIGMPWLHTQKSGLLGGVGEDAAFLVDRIISRKRRG
jgi:putative flavoprotein involved in K+ transport